MGRLNYTVRLIIRALFVVLCFVVTFTFTAIGSYQTDEIVMTSSADAPYCEITAKNGATAQCSVENGKLVFDIVQSGDEYDDIVIKLKTAPIKYDTTFLEGVMGEKEEYAEYIEKMKKGPWSAYISYRLTGDSVITEGDNRFTLRYGTEEITKSLLSKAANTNNSIDDVIVFQNDEFALDVVMGTSASGALSSGRYYLYTDLNISGLQGENNPKLSFIESIPAFLKLSVDALKTVNIKDIFNVSSWLTFYFIMVIFGGIFFLYPDMRATYRMATAGKSTVVKVTYAIYINGCYSGQASTYHGMSGISLFAFVFGYLFLLITTPIRIVAQIINSIVCIIRGDDYDYCDPIFSNILGSIGIYAVIAAILAFISSSVSNGNYVFAAITSVIGILLLIFANILSKRKEDEM